MKKAYKQLQKKLSNKFKRLDSKDYSVLGNVIRWVEQSGIKYNRKHLDIICNIIGSVPYPYQEKDRKVILKYLKNHKYKEFSKKFMI